LEPSNLDGEKGNLMDAAAYKAFTAWTGPNGIAIL
jgi:hypothetical protein